MPGPIELQRAGIADALTARHAEFMPLPMAAKAASRP
jgi:hypothetical protein